MRRAFIVWLVSGGALASTLTGPCPPAVTVLLPATAVAGYLNRGYEVLGDDEAARAFAARAGGAAVVSTTVGPFDARTTLKLSLATGQLLVSTATGVVALHTTLPVGRAPLGRFVDTAEVFRRLVEPAEIERRRTIIEEQPAFTAGQDLGARLRFSGTNVLNHFRKHVLGLQPQEGLDALTIPAYPRDRRRVDDFPALREEFQREYAAVVGNVAESLTLLNRFAERYEALARAFARATRPSILTFTRRVTVSSFDGELVSYRFDPQTNEFLVVNRSNERLVSYYRTGPDSTEARDVTMRTHGLPPARTPLEYFFALASLPPES